MKKYGLLLLVLTLCSCSKRPIDENSAIAVAQKALSLQGPVTAQKLAGGFSGAQLFTVTAGTQKYVARFIGHKPKKAREEEIAKLKIASQAGYGPHIYFADSEQAVIIMEYLDARPISEELSRSEGLYKTLAHLLQKIHRGPPFANTMDIFEFVANQAKQVEAAVKKEPGAGIPLAELTKILGFIQHDLTPHLISTPCHNDLHPRNLIFLGDAFKVIDLDVAAQSDPYFDVATVAVFCCDNPASEQTLFSTYLGRQPTETEIAKLYLMKQVVWIRCALAFLFIGSSKIGLYATLPVPSYTDFLKSEAAQRLETPEEQLSFAKTMINHVLANFESPEFSGAEKVLAKKLSRETIFDRIVTIPKELVLTIPYLPPLCDTIPGLKKGHVAVLEGSLYYEEEGGGIPLVLVNGGPGGTHHGFHPYFSQLSDIAHIIYYDQRGTGQSSQDSTGKTYTIRQAVEDLESLRKALKIDKWAVLGWSYGGLLAQCYALTYPERCTGLILVASQSGLYDPASKPIRDQMFISQTEQDAIDTIKRKTKEGKLTTDAQVIYNLALTGDWKRYSYYKPTPEELIRKALYAWNPAPGFEKLMRIESDKIDLQGKFDDFEIPTLILEAKWDLLWWNPDRAELIRKNHPHATVEIFDKSGHGIFADEPEKFFGLLRNFLEKLNKNN